MVILAAAMPAPASPELTLFTPADRAAAARVTTTDATTTLGDSGKTAVLKVATGHQQPWPGIALKPDGGPWNLSACGHVAVHLRNTSPAPLTLHCRVDNDGADGREHCLTGTTTLAPGADGLITVPLTRAGDDRMDGKLFGMRGYPKRRGGPGTVDPAKITQLLIFLNRPAEDRSFEVLDARAAGAYHAPTAWTGDADPFIPFIDTFGQYRHKDWPGKVKSEADLTERRDREAAALAADRGPNGWNRYGGWAGGPQQPATGFFHTARLNGKWWLVDPDGCLFFSHGIDCVRMMDATPVEERRDWFDAFPGDDARFAGLLGRHFALKGHYAGRKPECFSFAAANLLRKYGTDWQTVYPETIHRRLRAWGINTIANWSDERTRLLRKTPYTDTIGCHGARMIEGSDGYWGKFPDVFDPSFARCVTNAMRGKAGKSADDPWCIGYFSDNEMSWGDETSLAVAALKSPAGQPAKDEFIRGLQGTYGDIAKLNAAWGAGHASWEALAASREAPDKSKAMPDLTAFYRRTADAYFRQVRDAIKQVAPRQLYLGCRFAWANPLATAAAADHCDVVSFNLYQKDVAGFRFNGGKDVPLIIGEFHFGALDRGLFHTGLVPVADQQARAAAYTGYVLSALRHPQFVGCHWFQYQDEPTTGRVYDEENYQIGFIDIADTPYPEITAASRRVAELLYAGPAGETFTSAGGLVATCVKSADGGEGEWDTLIQKDGKPLLRIPNARPVSFNPAGDVLLLVEAAADDDCRHFLIKPGAEAKVPPFGQRKRIGGRFVTKHEWSEDGQSITLISDPKLGEAKPETIPVAGHLSSE